MGSTRVNNTTLYFSRTVLIQNGALYREHKEEGRNRKEDRTSTNDNSVMVERIHMQ
jgi:hypothetical protein